ncbi:MAG: hypothetical protein J6K37_05465 [Lachnospiraceae bacterium]|nr:hypothetical protein [Lachnospiraceae bacterium]
MKKIMLYSSIVMSVFYFVIVSLIIVGQEGIVPILNPYAEETIPMSAFGVEFILTVIRTVLVVLFAILLLQKAQSASAKVETIALILFTIMIVFSPWINNLGMIFVQTQMAMQSTDLLASYALMTNLIGGAGVVLSFAQILLLIYAGISLGRKERV